VLETNAPLSDLNINWTFGDSSIVGLKNPDFTVYNEGFMTGSVKVLSNVCGSELLNKSELFELYPMSDQKQVDAEVQLNQEITIIPKNEGPFVYSWSPQINLSDASIFSPIFTARKEIVYSLIIKDEYGCTAKESFKYTIDPDLLIFAPDVFTPNDDNLNNTFSFITVEGFYGEIKKLEIFNNLGEIIHRSGSTELIWDGKVKRERCTQWSISLCNNLPNWRQNLQKERQSSNFEIVSSRKLQNCLNKLRWFGGMNPMICSNYGQ
jgi:gliding motility-associated-like protein